MKRLTICLGTLALSSWSLACSAIGYEASQTTAQAHAATITSTKNGLTGATSLQLPANFTTYASETINGNTLCIVGSVTGDDGMNQKPVAYAQNGKTKQILWVARLDLPPNTFQSRATHCASAGNSTFVLLQSDTQSEQTLSQTLLRVEKLDSKTGIAQAKRDVNIPKAYSAWVDEGASHFQWTGSALLISGNYRASSDNDTQAQFTVHLNSDLNP